MTAEQVRALHEGTRDDRYHALWVLASTTGMRLGEMLALTWEDVHLGDVSSDRLQTGRRGDDRDRPRGEVGRVHVSRPVGAVADDPHLSGTRSDPYVTVHATLHRIDGEWQRRDTKTEKSRRTIPLPAVTVEALKRQLERQREELDGGGTRDAAHSSEGGEGRGPRRGPRPLGDSRRGVESARGSGVPDVLRADERGTGTHHEDALHRQPTPIAAARNRLVFTTERGFPIHGSNLPKELHKATDRLGLPRVTIHDLRHSAATVLYAAGTPLPVIADILGHSTIRVTSDLYRHRVPELSREAAEAMQRAVG